MFTVIYIFLTFFGIFRVLLFSTSVLPTGLCFSNGVGSRAWLSWYFDRAGWRSGNWLSSLV